MKVTIYQHTDALPELTTGNFFHSREYMAVCEQTPRLKPYMAVVTNDEGNVVAHLLAIMRIRGSFLPPYLYTHVRIYGDNGCSTEHFDMMLKSLTRLLQNRTLYIEISDLREKMFGYRQKSDVLSADSKLLKEIRSCYKDEYQHIPLELRFTAQTGEKMRLTATDGTHTVRAESEDVVEKALHLPLSEERAAQSLKKTGNTPYYIKNITMEIAPDAAASAASINALRRKALESLDAAREICHNYKINSIDLTSVLSTNEKTSSENRAFVRTLDFPDSMRRMDRIFVDLFGMADENKLIRLLNEGYPVGVEVPRATFGNEKEVYARLKKLKELGVSHLIAHNIAAVYMGKELGYTVHAGFGMNIVNSYTLRWAADYGIASAQLSVEIELRQIERLRKSIPVGIIRYGYFPLMITRNSPSGKSCKNNPYLQDRKNEKFLVTEHEGYSEIVNCVPILMPKDAYPLDEKVMSDFLFPVENSVENMEKTLEKLRENQNFERKTHGLYLRGVKKSTSV